MDEKEKLAYLAGIIDGEGNIGIYKSTQNKNGSYMATLRIVSTDIKLINWLCVEFDGYYVTQVYSKKYNYSDRHTWELSGREQYKLLKRIKEYLIIKKEQAELNISYYEKVGRWNWRGGRNEGRPIWVKKFQEECYQKSLKLNHRGLCHEQPE